MTFVKFCGFTIKDDVDFANTLNLNAVGFIACKQSKRYQTPSQVASLVKDIKQNIFKVVVTVDENIEVIKTYLKYCNMVQLHGNEGQDYIDSLPKNVPIIKAVSVYNEATLKKALAYKVDYLLVDARVDEGEIRGGTGKKADWQWAKQLVEQSKIRVILAGGITALNINDALQEVKPYGIDLSSAIEVSKGVKSHKKMQSFMQKISNI